jgi:hypothetical protein
VGSVQARNLDAGQVLFLLSSRRFFYKIVQPLVTTGKSRSIVFFAIERLNANAR